MEISVRNSVVMLLFYSQGSRQGSNALNKSMQGLWSNHTSRRNKLNLNALNAVSSSSTPPPADELPSSVTIQDVFEGEAPALAANVQALNSADPAVTSDLRPSVTSGKRKIRSSKTSDETSKRAKLSGACAVKDHAPPSTRLADLGGVDACVEKLLELVAMPLCHPEVYLHTGVQPPRGVLLHGPPGCGKTLLANAMAGVSLIRLFYRGVLISCYRNWVCHSSVSLLPPLFPECLVNLRRPSETPLTKLRCVETTRTSRIRILMSFIHSGLHLVCYLSTRSTLLHRKERVHSGRWNVE